MAKREKLFLVQLTVRFFLHSCLYIGFLSYRRSRIKIEPPPNHPLTVYPQAFYQSLKSDIMTNFVSPLIPHSSSGIDAGQAACIWGCTLYIHDDPTHTDQQMYTRVVQWASKWGGGDVWTHTITCRESQEWRVRGEGVWCVEIMVF